MRYALPFLTCLSLWRLYPEIRDHPLEPSDMFWTAEQILSEVSGDTAAPQNALWCPETAILKSIAERKSGEGITVQPWVDGISGHRYAAASAKAQDLGYSPEEALANLLFHLAGRPDLIDVGREDPAVEE